MVSSFFGALNPPRSARPFHLSSDWTALYGNYNTGAFVEMGWSGYMFEMESDEGCTKFEHGSGRIFIANA